MHNEFTCKFKNGKRDWVDPVVDVEETDTHVNVYNGAFWYTFDKDDMELWCVRPYHENTTLDPVDEEITALRARVVLLEAEKDIAVRMANFRTIECRKLRDKLYGEDKV